MMRKIRFAAPRKSASKEDILLFEQRWELRLPAVLRHFFEGQNGGIPSKDNNFYPVPEAYNAFRKEYGVVSGYPVGIGLAWFLSLTRDGGELTVDKTMNLLLISDQLVPNQVPLADDGCGNLVMVSVGAQDYGSIYFWDHELHSEFLIAADFAGFLKGLIGEPDLPRH